jgi:hypothetical protein
LILLDGQAFEGDSSVIAVDSALLSAVLEENEE